LLGGELIDCLQKIAGNVADRQHLNSRCLRQWSNSSGALTSSCPKIKLSPPFPAISAASVVIVLFILSITLFSGNGGAKFRKSLKIFQKLQKRLIQWAHGRESSLEKSAGNLGKQKIALQEL